MSEINELKSILDLIRWAASRFNEAGLYYGHGTENAWDEAYALIMHTLHLPYDSHPSILNARITSIEREQLHRLIQRRIHDRVPVPYLTQEAWFADLPYFVDERVLIPRSPLAETILNQFDPWLGEQQPARILDLCTGSGCIAIACAKAFPEADVVASDLSKDALAVAKINVLRHSVADQITLIESDLFDAIPAQRFDIIISNPPYVDAEDMADLPEEYRHEPAGALAAGEFGLDLAVRILQKAGSYLSEQGLLIVEVGNSELALAEQFPAIPFTWLEFERGGGGVFLLTAEQLKAAQTYLTSSA